MSKKENKLDRKDEDQYIYKKRVIIEKVKIPDGYIKCPQCHGFGEVPFKYVDFSPWQRVEYVPCPLCRGRGYIKRDAVEG